MTTGMCQDDRISPIATRRIISITLVLVRQSMNSGNIHHQQGNDEHLVRLLDRLLESYSSPDDGTLGIAVMWGGCDVNSSLFATRTSDYYMSCLSSRRSATLSHTSLIAGWMIDLFLCFRDVVVVVSSMDVHARRRTSSTFLKWCCLPDHWTFGDTGRDECM